MTTLWAVYLTVCAGSTCVGQEGQRFEPPNPQAQCEVMLKQYSTVPRDGDWDTVEWQCLPLNGAST